MGAGISILFQKQGIKNTHIAWTAKEIEENNLAEAAQSESLAFTLKHFFHNSVVPVRYAKRSLDPTSPLWIEPSPSLFSEDNNEVKVILQMCISKIMITNLTENVGYDSVWCSCGSWRKY